MRQHSAVLVLELLLLLLWCTAAASLAPTRESADATGARDHGAWARGRRARARARASDAPYRAGVIDTKP